MRRVVGVKLFGRWGEVLRLHAWRGVLGRLHGGCTGLALGPSTQGAALFCRFEGGHAGSLVERGVCSVTRDHVRTVCLTEVAVCCT